MENIVLFREVTDLDFDKVGFKGLSLAKLYKNSYNTPPGFIITSSAFINFIEQTNLKAQIKDLLIRITKELTNVEEISGMIQKLILNTELPELLKEDILEAYDSLSFDPQIKDASSLLDTKEEFVAVRSSFLSNTNEQQSQSHLLLLNIKGEQRLIEAIKKCYASLYEKDTIAYRIANNIAPEASLAIVVQKMIDSEKSGIASSVNSLNNNTGEILIKACFGLGQALISGNIYPDIYVINKQDNSIKEVTVQDKQYEYVRDVETDKTVKHHLKEKSKTRVLEDSEIKEISRIVKKIVMQFGSEQRIEWSIKKGELFVLQAKEIEKPSSKEEPMHEAVPERIELEVYESEDEEVPDMIDIQEETEHELLTLNEQIPPVRIEEEEIFQPEEGDIEEVGMQSQDSATQLQEEYKETDTIGPVQEQDETFEEEEAILNFDDQLSSDREANNEPQPENMEIIETPSISEDDSIFSSFRPADISDQTEDEKPQEDNKSEEPKLEWPSIASKIFYNAGNLIVSCDMAITSKLKEKYLGEFNKTTNNFHELVDSLSELNEVPFFEEIIRIHELKTEFEEKYTEPSPEEVAMALATVRKLLEN